jgi:hypothetical protein
MLGSSVQNRSAVLRAEVSTFSNGVAGGSLSTSRERAGDGLGRQRSMGPDRAVVGVIATDSHADNAHISGGFWRADHPSVRSAASTCDQWARNASSVLKDRHRVLPSSMITIISTRSPETVQATSRRSDARSYSQTCGMAGLSAAAVTCPTIPTDY